MDERVRRHWAGSEAEAIGRGGIAIVANATGIAKRTIGVGRGEVRTGERPDDLVRVRRAGGGRMRHEEIHPELLSALS